MAERTFTVAYVVAELAVGTTVTESQLSGCNVDALVQGGFLLESGNPPATEQVIPPPPFADTTPPPPDTTPAS